MIKTVRNGQNSQRLNAQMENIEKDLKKDWLRLQGELNKKKQTIKLIRQSHKND